MTNHGLLRIQPLTYWRNLREWLVSGAESQPSVPPGT